MFKRILPALGLLVLAPLVGEYLLGNVAINATNIRDVANPMFDPAGPQCWFQKQASWIPAFWPGNRDVEDQAAWANPPGEASSFFYQARL